MDREKFADRIMLFKDEIYDFEAEEHPDELKKTTASINSLLKGRIMDGTLAVSRKEVVGETRKAYALALRDENTMNAADRFFVKFCDELDDDESEVVNSLRRAKLSIFLIDEKDGNSYKITDSRTAAQYQFRTVDDLNLPKGEGFLGCISPSHDGVWQPIGGMIVIGNGEWIKEQAGIAQRKQEMQELMGREFLEYFKSRIATFATREECERAYGGFMEWQNLRRERENAERGIHDKPPSCPKFRLKHDIPVPVNLFMTREGIVFVPEFSIYEKLAAGAFEKEKRERMTEAILSTQGLFPDPIFETIYLERENELLKLASEAFEDVRGREDLHDMILYFRPAIFDPCLPRLTLMKEGKPVEDIWNSGPFGKEDGDSESGGEEKAEGSEGGHGGTGYTEINDANREEFYSILQPIESAIARCYRKDPKLKDRDVIGALKKLRDTYGRGDEGGSLLEREMLAAIRRAVGRIGGYDSNDVIMCLRCILKSAKLHHREGGSRGYLDFIQAYV